MQLKREKERTLISPLFYRLIKLPLSDRTKFKLFLNLEWIFDRLSHEMSFRVYETEKHPFRLKAFDFISKFIKSDDLVLDLGCANGEIANKIAEKALFVLGVDHSPELVESAKKYSKKIWISFV